MESLKRWNQKVAADKTYNNMKAYMRKEYLDLQEVGGLTVNSTLNQANLVQELKEHQDAIADNLKDQLTENFKEMTQSMNFIINDENKNPNLRSHDGYQQGQDDIQSLDNNVDLNMFAAMQKQNMSNPMLLHLAYRS